MINKPLNYIIPKAFQEFHNDFIENFKNKG